MRSRDFLVLLAPRRLGSGSESGARLGALKGGQEKYCRGSWASGSLGPDVGIIKTAQTTLAAGGRAWLFERHRKRATEQCAPPSAQGPVPAAAVHDWALGEMPPRREDLAVRRVALQPRTVGARHASGGPARSTNRHPRRLAAATALDPLEISTGSRSGASQSYQHSADVLNLRGAGHRRLASQTAQLAAWPRVTSRAAESQRYFLKTVRTSPALEGTGLRLAVAGCDNGIASLGENIVGVSVAFRPESTHDARHLRPPPAHSVETSDEARDLRLRPCIGLRRRIAGRHWATILS
ncbi:hypothetical protein ACCO45_013381 [Purpureocillium lilacinum]|uniref:Uncharacterized protein n=1 Tax=Purpureocillium lilacinum TaxID=33203 RepID=A0ACC4D692_PURLI